MIELQTDTDLFGNETAAGAKIDRAMLAAGLYANLKDVSLEEFARLLTNNYDAVIDYANLSVGAKTGQRISLLFNPHRLDTRTKQRSVFEAIKDARFCDGLARVAILKNETTRDMLYASIGMGVNHTSYIQEFPPHVARELALEYRLTKSSRVLDPCAGWGGRMIGFSTVVDSYTCCEPSTKTASGLRKLHDWLRVFRSDFNATIHEAPFEDVELPAQSFDFALTSPPYYDTERYADEPTNSFKRYTTFDAWCHGFYAPLIHRTMAALKLGAPFVLNIGSRVYPLNDRLASIADGRYRVEKLKGKLSASNGLGKDGEGETFYELRNTSGSVIVLTEPALESPTPSCSPVRRQPAPSGPSALAFLAAQSALEPPQEPASSQTSEPPVAPPIFDPDRFLAGLRDKSVRLLTRDGKLFAQPAGKLTEDEKKVIRGHKAELIALAEALSIPEPVVSSPSEPAPIITETPPSSLFAPEPRQSLVQFLGTDVPRRDPDYRPDEIPEQLPNEIVLNFLTDGLDWAHGHKPAGVTISSLDGTLTRFLPFALKGGGNLDETTVKRFVQSIRGKKIYGANLRFDLHHARVWGCDLEEQGNRFSDIMHTCALLDDHRKRFALDILAEDYLPGNVVVPRLDETRHAEYAASEVDARERYTAQLVGKLRDVTYPEIDKQELRAVHDLEDAVIPCVVEMEHGGAPLDMELNEQYYQECNRRHDALLWEIAKECGFAFDHKPSSWKRLFEYCRIPPSDSYKESVLSQINHPLIQKGHLASQLASLNSKTFAAYRGMVGSDNILHFELNQLRGDEKGTVSGRFSAGFIQQVPNHGNHAAVFGEDLFPRRLYVAGSGQYLSADASQIQYRIFQHHVNNPRIAKMYAENPKASFHRMIESLLRPYKPDLIYEHVKSMNFMVIFGGGIVKIAVMMGFISEAVGDEITGARTQKTDPRLSQAREIKAIYDREIKEVGPLLRKASHLAMSECNDYCRKGDELHRKFPHRGFVRTILGRRSRPTYDFYRAFCLIDQGTEGDIMKTKIVELHKARRETGFKMRMTVHDEISGDATEPDTLQKVDAILNRQSFPQISVPILFECGQGRTWADAK